MLDERRVAWESHVLLLGLYETNRPDYVRLNPRAVVPTLVVDGKVTTDTANILRHVSGSLETGPALVPCKPEEAACMEKFLRMGDTLPAEPLTFGHIPGAKKPLPLRIYSKNKYHKLDHHLDGLLKAHADDAYLVAVYKHKRDHKKSTAHILQSPDEMTRIMESARSAIGELDQQLQQGPFKDGGWLCGKNFSLADIEWGVVLNRLQWVNLSPLLWRDKPLVADYLARLKARPSFKSAIVDWGHPFTQVFLPGLWKKLLKKL